MNLRFLPWDDRLATLHLLYHVWGPVLDGHPTESTAIWALYFAAPELAVDYDVVKRAVQKIVWGKDLTEEEKRIVRAALRLKPPAWMREKALAVYERLPREFEGVKGALAEVVGRAHGRWVLEGEIRIFPSFEIGATGGSAYVDEVGINPGVSLGPRAEEINRELPRILVHELIHIYVRRDERFTRALWELSERYRLPVTEAHVEALTNVVWWRAGRAKRMFERHYSSRWRALCRLERRYWKAVRTWWRRGGDLLERVRSAL